MNTDPAFWLQEALRAAIWSGVFLITTELSVGIYWVLSKVFRL